METTTDDIAVIGYACRLSGDVSSPEDLWELCTRGRTGWCPIPEDRFCTQAFHHPNPLRPGTLNPKGGYFLRDDLTRFDAAFFNITESEAISMDPQQRLLLECTFEAIENAGIPKEQLAGRSVGVYIGGNFSDYELRNIRDLETTPMHHITGCSLALQSNRISHYYDLRGPSMTIDTACSSSLVALHHAVQSLKSGETTEAIVAGCRLNLLPDYFVTMSMSQLFNDTGKTFAFDERADSGFARGEGVGVVLLKPLSAAIRDRDPVRAVIRGTGVNQDGKTQGITNPSEKAQQTLIQEVYAKAGLDVKNVGYAEMHGTGTKVGDPIEASAVHKALAISRSSKDPLYIGSVKTNVGHLEGASGVISLIKASMMLYRGMVLPSANFHKPNPAIPMDDWNLKVLTTTKPWPRGKKYVSVSNYGFGGVNGHLILERPPVLEDMSPRPGDKELLDPISKLLTVSANSRDSLQSRLDDLRVYFEQRPEVFEKMQFPNVVYTFGSRRSHLGHRIAMTASSLDVLGIQFAQTKLNTSKVLGHPVIGFIFTGQGAQWARMGLELLTFYPVFESIMIQADKLLKQLGAEFSLLEELQRPIGESRIDCPEISQPTCTAVQIGLVHLFKSWGISPDAVIGHSSGEIAAAYAAGVLDADAAMAIAHYRGVATLKLRQQFPELEGRMLAVGASVKSIRSYMDQIADGYLTIACVNSPSSVTISGDASAISKLKSALDSESIFNRMLKVDMAYHSEHMARMADFYLSTISQYLPNSALKAKFYSSLRGCEITAAKAIGPMYWVDNLTSSVLFSDAMASMCSGKITPNVLIEIGPHSTLKGPIKDILKARGGESNVKIEYCNSMTRNADTVQTMQQAAGTIYVHGAVLDMTAINFPRSKARYNTILTDLPSYNWNHQKAYWHDSRVPRQHESRSAARNDVLGLLTNYSIDLEPTWRNIVRLEDVPWLRHHKMQGLPVFPMAGYISMVIEAAEQHSAGRGIDFDGFELRDVVVGAALPLEEGTPTEMITNLRPFNDAAKNISNVWDEFRVASWSSKRGWTEHCRGQVRVTNSAKSRDQPFAMDSNINEGITAKWMDDIVALSTEWVDVQAMYKRLVNVGVTYGETFQGLRNCFAGSQCCYGEISIQRTEDIMPKSFEPSLLIHPCFLDTFTHVLWPVIGALRDDFDTIFMPIEVRNVKIDRCILKDPAEHLCVYSMENSDAIRPKASFELFATRPGTSIPAIQYKGMVSIALDNPRATSQLAVKKTCYKLVSQPLTLPMHKQHPHTNGISAVGATIYARDFPIVNGFGHDEMARMTLEKSRCTIVQFGEDVGFVSGLSAAIEESTGVVPDVKHLATAIDLPGNVILLQTATKSLRTITAADFECLKTLLLQAKKVLWVYDRENLDTSMSVGLSRSIRSEHGSPIAMLGIQDIAVDLTNHCKNIGRLMDMLWYNAPEVSIKDMEFTVSQDQFFVERVQEDEYMNKLIANETGVCLMGKQPFFQTGSRRTIQIGTYGSLDSIHWKDEPSQKLQDNWVEIQVKATGINFKDVVVCMGQVSQPYIGVECSGIVVAAGKDVPGEVLGKRVMAMVEGAYSTYTRCPASSVHAIDDNMTFESAATIPVVFCTAYYALYDLARLAKGERILIHAAAGGVGQAAIMLAQMVGAEIYATVSSISKKQFLKDKYNLQEDRILYSRNTSFAAEIQILTNGAGIDVVLNSLAGEILFETWNCLAPFGRFIEIGKADITRKGRLDMSKFEENCTFSSVDLTKVATSKPELMQRLLSDVCRLMDAGTLSPISPVKVYSIEETESALRSLQSGKAMGKLVVVAREGDQVLAPLPKFSKNLLQADATYLIIGGTGGLGRSLAKWMSAHGAGNVILISRSARVTPLVQALMDDLAPQKTAIHVKQCDVSDQQSVTDLIKSNMVGLPPIKGVVHAAMVLQDMLYEKMTVNNFHAVTRCKVDGILNLHSALLDTKLDFFVALSSVAGIIGNRGQAAYSAANVFLDEFMKYRRKQELPGASIDLSAVSDVGYLAEGPASVRDEVIRNVDGTMIDEGEVLALIGAAIDGKMDEFCSGQCITGLNTTNDSAFWLNDSKFNDLREAMLEAAGMDDATLKTVSLSDTVRAAKNQDEACDTLCAALMKKIAVVLDVPEDSISSNRALKDLGLDSLVGIEIRSWIGREMEVNVQVLELLTSGSVLELTELILRKMGL